MNVPTLKRSLSEISDRISRASPKKDKRLKRSSTAVASLNSVTQRSLLPELAEKKENQVESSQQWYDRFAPQRIEEVALHKRKLEEVRTELEGMISGKSEKRILVLSGPSGSSKSTCVKLLSKELVPRYRYSSEYTLSGKEQPTVTEYLSDMNTSSSTESFQEFLLQSKYMIGRNLSVLLVEDMPNLFHERTAKLFKECLLAWLFSNDKVPPLVICLTECQLPLSGEFNPGFGLDVAFVAETVLGKEILNHPLVSRIRFNPINNSLMLKHLKHIFHNVRTEIPPDKYKKGSKFINRLASSTGDIRSAIAALQFWCTSSSQDYDADFVRESSTSYFHGIGKVIYGSKNKCSTDKDVINDLMDNALIPEETFQLGILENYSKFNKGEFPIDDAYNILEALSVSDAWKRKGSDQESFYYSLLKTRSIFSNIECSNSNAHGQANFTREYKMLQEQRRTNLELQDFINVEFYKYSSLWSTKDACLYGSFYAPLIRKLLSFKGKSLRYYMRSLDENSFGYEKTKNNERILHINELDVLDRIGGNMNMMHASSDLEIFPKDSTYENLKLLKERKLEKLKSLYAGESLFEDSSAVDQATEFDEDPIISSDTEPAEDKGGIEDEGDSELYEILSQRPKKSTSSIFSQVPHLAREPSENIVLSDSDIENL